jgi:hypothetical protein
LLFRMFACMFVLRAKGGPSRHRALACQRHLEGACGDTEARVHDTQRRVHGRMQAWARSAGVRAWKFVRACASQAHTCMRARASAWTASAH